MQSRRHHTQSLIIHGLAACLAVGVLLAGCGQDATVSAPAGNTSPDAAGVLSVTMRSFDVAGDASIVDASVQGDHGRREFDDLAALFMTFDAVRVYPVGADTAGAEPHECIYLEFEIEPVTVDVMELQISLNEALGTLELPQGEYTHLAIHVAELWGQDQAGELVAVHLPPEHDGWLKILVPFAIEEGVVTEIVFAVDLMRSLREVPPGSGVYMMIPVLHGEMTWGPGPGQHHQEGGPHHGGDQGHGGSQGGGGGTHGGGNCGSSDG